MTRFSIAVLAAVCMLTSVDTQPVLAFGCGVPKLASVLDDMLAGNLTPNEREIAAKGRWVIAEHAQSNDLEKARATEEQTMRALGYHKVWLRCGPGTFMWEQDGVGR